MRHSAFLCGALLVAANAGYVRAHSLPPPPSNRPRIRLRYRSRFLVPRLRSRTL